MPVGWSLWPELWSTVDQFEFFINQEVSIALICWNSIYLFIYLFIHLLSYSCTSFFPTVQSLFYVLYSILGIIEFTHLKAFYLPALSNILLQ